jgi:tetratricopeptide (TPR) repeat protein
MDRAATLRHAEKLLEVGALDEAAARLQPLVAADPDAQHDVAKLGWSLAGSRPDAGFRLVELAADAALRRHDWPSAAATVQEFVTRAPGHVPALQRLVAICRDGGLDATLSGAQSRLADVHLANGEATAARMLAEDLIAREPWERGHLERFRRALVLLGEPNPDGVIADRLSGDSPFTTNELMLAVPEIAPFDEPPHPTPSLQAGVEQPGEAAVSGEEATDEGVIADLKAASRSPQTRFAAASRLARICRERGDLPEAIEWFERAIEGVPPSPDAGFELMYELASALETTGEQARALAVFLELQADAGGYRDVSARVERLARVHTRG